MNAVKGLLRLLRNAIVLICCVATYNPAFAEGRNGTTLAAYKTVDICSVSTNVWRYSGEIALWNEGAVATENLSIIDKIQYKTGTTWVNAFTALAGSGVIPAGTTQATAVIFPYSVDSAALPGTIRNVASITITNHSGSLGIPKGPEPKATFMGEIKPCPNPGGGCTYTQGYWGNKPGVIWPDPYDRNAFFFMSGKTWQQVMDTPVNAAQGYYQLAHQYIAAVLNIANGASAPAGVTTTLSLAEAWLSTNIPASCTAGGSCGLQKDWAKLLDDYNNGQYPGGPPHCD
jgi:hypothetical protein